jgi:serine/threonine protein kinase
MLKAFSRSRHPHLVRLLATYRHKRRYFLLFPWAKSNLRKYWEDTPRPDFSEATVLWSLRQCKAIASGLHMIHEYRSTQDSLKARSLQPPPASSGNPAVEDDDRLYGRHGDIKPENILWSVEEVLDDSQCSNEEGVLLIADFGLMDFHNRLTRSQVHPDKITGSPTYEPPELKLHTKISRAYDIWSLGCVYLEFITWLVGGWAELDHFPKAREVAGWNGISDDTFFTIMEFGTQPRAIVRGGVQAWMKDLHEKPRCSAFIHDFLNLVSEDMLVVNPKHRIHCGPLNERLSSMLAKAKANPLYLTEGRPTRRSSACAQQYGPLSRTLSESSDNNPSPAEGTPLPKRPSVVSSLDELAHSSPEIVPSIYIEMSPPSSPQLL